MQVLATRLKIGSSDESTIQAKRNGVELNSLLSAIPRVVNIQFAKAPKVMQTEK